MHRVLIVCGLATLATPTLAATLDPATGRLILGSPDSDARVEFFDGGFTLFGSNSAIGTRSVDRFEFDVVAPPFAAPTVAYDLDNTQVTLTRGVRPAAEPALPTFTAGQLAAPFLQGRSLDEPLRFSVREGYDVSARVPYELTYDRAVLSFKVEYGTDDVDPFFDVPACAFGCRDGTIVFDSVANQAIQFPPGVLRPGPLSNRVPQALRRFEATAEWQPETLDDLRQALLDPDRVIELDWAVEQPFTGIVASIEDYVEPRFQAAFDGGVRTTFAVADVLALFFAEIDSKDQMGGAAWLTFTELDLRIEQVTRTGMLVITTVPVPPAVAGMLAGMGLLGWIARRKRLAHVA